jgi:hypothetical protein
MIIAAHIRPTSTGGFVIHTFRLTKEGIERRLKDEMMRAWKQGVADAQEVKIYPSQDPRIQPVGEAGKQDSGPAQHSS